MRVLWTPEALQDRSEIWDYIALDNATAAARMDALFSQACARLEDHPLLGRAGQIMGTRELIVHESYRLVYECDEAAQTVWVLVLMHTARLWPPAR